MVEVSADVRRRVGFLLLAVASMIFVFHGFESEPKFFWSRDFKPLYAGARCLLHGRNPYDTDALRREYLQAGGEMNDTQPFEPHYALYPPPAFVLVMPFALLPWQPAHYLFLATSAGLLIAASFLVAAICVPFSPLLAPSLIGLFLLGANPLMMLAQPAGLTIGLCVIGTVLLLRGKYTALAVLTFAFSLALKPHTGAFVWLYFFVNPKYRARAAAIFVVTALLCIPGTIWVSVMPASAHWIRQLQENLKVFELPGALSDPGPRDLQAFNMTTLQTVVSLFRDDRAFYNRISWGVCGVLLVAILAAVRRRHLSSDREVYAIAALVCLSLLPVYHRMYDTKLLLLCFPALAMVLQRAATSWSASANPESATLSRWQALTWTGLAAILCLLVENDRYSFILNACMDAPDPAHMLKTILLIRNIPMILLAETLIYLTLLWRAEAEARECRSIRK